MDRQPIIDRVESFAKDRLSGEPTGHDWWHAVRVRNNSRHLQSIEGGDIDVIDLASYIHDIGDRKVLGTDEDDHSIARKFLQEIGVDTPTIEHVMYIVENMSYSKSIDNPNVEKSTEFQVVQDADRLDALGAIGVARAFAYGGRAGRLLYNPEESAQDFATTAAYKNSKGSTLAHFDEKLFRLRDTFNTATARKIAARREAYMRGFYDQFLNEWDGDE